MPKPDTLSWLFADQPGPPIHGGQHADRRAVELEKQIQAVRADPAQGTGEAQPEARSTLRRSKLGRLTRCRLTAGSC